MNHKYMIMGIGRAPKYVLIIDNFSVNSKHLMSPVTVKKNTLIKPMSKQEK